MTGIAENVEPAPGLDGERLDLEEVAARVAADDSGKWDVTVPRDALWLEGGRLRFPRSGGTSPGRRAGPLVLSEWATAQLCQRLGMPAAYFKRCPPYLRDAQANYWLRQGETAGKEGDAEVAPGEPDPHGPGGGEMSLPPAAPAERHWLLRARGDTARAILSERYARMDNARVLAALAPVLADGPFEVRWLSLSEGAFHLRLVDPRLWRDVLPGDAVTAGLHIANSEVGLRCLTVDALVWRLVCTNGLVRLVKGKSLFARRHLGGVLPEAELRALLSTAVREALVHGAGFLERLSTATRIPLGDPATVITTLAGAWGLSRALQEAITAALLAEGRGGQQETLYGLVNALTFVAQRLGPDERLELEVRAGHLLEAGPPTVARLREGTPVAAGGLPRAPGPSGPVPGATAAAAAAAAAARGTLPVTLSMDRFLFAGEPAPSGSGVPPERPLKEGATATAPAAAAAVSAVEEGGGR